jgi:hypothetical protein
MDMDMDMDMVTYIVGTLKSLCEANSRALLHLVQLRPSLHSPFEATCFAEASARIRYRSRAQLECWCLAQ